VFFVCFMFKFEFVSMRERVSSTVGFLSFWESFQKGWWNNLKGYFKNEHSG